MIFNVLIHDGDLSCAGRREGMADRVCKIAANHQEKGEGKFFLSPYIYYLPTEGDGRLCFCWRRYVGRYIGI